MSFYGGTLMGGARSGYGIRYAGEGEGGYYAPKKYTTPLSKTKQPKLYQAYKKRYNSYRGKHPEITRTWGEEQREPALLQFKNPVRRKTFVSTSEPSTSEGLTEEKKKRGKSPGAIFKTEILRAVRSGGLNGKVIYANVLNAMKMFDELYNHHVH